MVIEGRAWANPCLALISCRYISFGIIRYQRVTYHFIQYHVISFSIMSYHWYHQVIIFVYLTVHALACGSHVEIALKVLWSQTALECGEEALGVLVSGLFS